MNGNERRPRRPHRRDFILLAGWRRLNLWPRLALGVTLGFIVLFAGFSLVGIRAVNESTDRILQERLAITEMLAQNFDGLLAHAFSDLAAYRPGTEPANRQRPLLDVIYQHGRRRVRDGRSPRPQRQGRHLPG